MHLINKEHETKTNFLSFSLWTFDMTNTINREYENCNQQIQLGA